MKFSNTIKTVLKIYQKYVKNSVWFGTGAFLFGTGVYLARLTIWKYKMAYPLMASQVGEDVDQIKTLG